MVVAMFGFFSLVYVVNRAACFVSNSPDGNLQVRVQALGFIRAALSIFYMSSNMDVELLDKRTGKTYHVDTFDMTVLDVGYMEFMHNPDLVLWHPDRRHFSLSYRFYVHGPWVIKNLVYDPNKGVVRELPTSKLPDEEVAATLGGKDAIAADKLRDHLRYDGPPE